MINLYAHPTGCAFGCNQASFSGGLSNEKYHIEVIEVAPRAVVGGA